jgi:hypothetical protein
MAKETDEKFTPTTFTKTDDRGEHTLTAHSPADAVRLRFDGWQEKKTGARQPAAAPKP